MPVAVTVRTCRTYAPSGWPNRSPSYVAPQGFQSWSTVVPRSRRQLCGRLPVIVHTGVRDVPGVPGPVTAGAATLLLASS